MKLTEKMFFDTSIKKAAFSSMFFSLAGKVLTFAQSIVVSYTFGIQSNTDIIMYTVGLLYSVMFFIGGINSQIIVPTVLIKKNKEGIEGANEIVSAMFTLYAILGAILTIVMYIYSLKIIGTISKFSDDVITLNIKSLRIISVTFFFILINTFILDVMNAYRAFTLPMILDMVKSLIIILLVAVGAHYFGIVSLAYGIMFGNMLQSIILIIICKKVLKLHFRLNISSTLKKLEGKKNFLYVFISYTIMFLKNIFIARLLTGFPSGFYTSQDYAQKINTIVFGVVVVQIMNVIGIKIIELYANGDNEALRERFFYYLKFSIFIILPICFLISLNSFDLIRVMFHRGKFDLKAVKITASFLQILVLGIPLNFVNYLFVRLIIAKQLQRHTLIWHIVGDPFNYVLQFVAISNIGFLGYPIADFIFMLINLVYVYFIIIRRQFSFIRLSECSKELIKIISLNSILYALLHFAISKSALNVNIITSLVRMTIICVTYISIYALFNLIDKDMRVIQDKYLTILKGIFFKAQPQYFKKVG